MYPSFYMDLQLTEIHLWPTFEQNVLVTGWESITAVFYYTLALTRSLFQKKNRDQLYLMGLRKSSSVNLWDKSHLKSCILGNFGVEITHSTCAKSHSGWNFCKLMQLRQRYGVDVGGWAAEFIASRRRSRNVTISKHTLTETLKAINGGNWRTTSTDRISKKTTQTNTSSKQRSQNLHLKLPLKSNRLVFGLARTAEYSSKISEFKWCTDLIVSLTPQANCFE